MISFLEMFGSQSADSAGVSSSESSAVCAPQRTDPVGQVSHDLDAELEAHIADCGRRMQESMARWEAHGNFADRGDASYWLRLMEEGVKARSAAQVARMELERGLR